MSKTTFLGYVPSLKSKHEAKIVGHKAIQSKGGSIRYTLQGEYDGRKTLPKTVSKADFEGVYGFDAKEAEAVIIQGKKGKEDAVQLHIVGIDDKTDFTPEKIVPIKTMNEYGHKKLEKEIDGLDATKSNHAETVGNPSPASVEPPAPSESPFPQEPSNENFSAFGFGKKDEESEEPKTQEFTVIMQEGDKLELTDLEDEQPGAADEQKEEDSDENEEKEAESNQDIKWNNVKEQADAKCPFCFRSAFRLIGEEGEEFSVYEEDIAGDNWLLECSRCKAEWNQDGENTLDGGYTGNAEAENYEAVSAKVTRPVKEEDEEDEDGEGLSTLAKVGLGVGALAVGAAIFGAEDYDEDGESDYWAGEETYSMNAEGVYEAEVNVGEKRIMGRKDYDIDNDLSGFSNMEVGDIDLEDYEDEITTSVEDEVIEAIRESVDDAMPISDGDSISSSVNVDTELEITVPISGDIDYDWTANETHEDENHDDEWNAESDGYTYAYTKGHNDGINDEVIYRPSIATDKGRNIYKKILKQKAEEIEGDEEYDDYLDGLEEDALVLYKDTPSHLFEKAYPIDYEVGMNDYESSLLADIQSGYTENSKMFDEDENLTPYGESVLKEMYDSLIDEALGIEWLASRHPPSEILKRGDPMAYRVGLSEYQDSFETDTVMKDTSTLKMLGGIGLIAAGLFAFGQSDRILSFFDRLK